MTELPETEQNTAQPQTEEAQTEEMDNLSGEQADDPMTALAAERDELKDQLLRAMAEAENLRRRTEKEVAAAKKYGAVGMARDLLASFDNLEKAIELIPEDKSELDDTLKNILIGVEMTGRELSHTLERHGISEIAPVNEKFDYNLHQAMFEVPTDEVEPGMVVQLVQKGYSLHDRLLRPAMVGVSKAAEAEASDDKGSKE